MTFLKKLLLGLLLILTILVTSLWIIAKSIKPEVIKDYVNSQLTTLTAQKSSVEGDISWHLFPRPGVRITSIKVGDIGGDAPFAMTLDKLLFNLNITPLLRGKLEFSELKVDGFKIRINSDAKPSQATSKPVNHAPQKEKQNIAKSFAIARLMLSRGQIIWTRQKTRMTISGLQLGAEQLNLQQQSFPFQLKGKLDVTRLQQRLAKSRVNFKGRVELPAGLLHNPENALKSLFMTGQLTLQDTELKTFRFDRLKGNAELKKGIAQLNPLTVSLYHGESIGDLRYDTTQHKLAINQTATNLNSGKLIQNLTGKKLLQGSLDFSLHTLTDLQNTDWQSNTTANGNFTIRDGTLLTIDFNKVIDEINNKIGTLLKIRNINPQQELDLAQLDAPMNYNGETPFKLLTLQYRLDKDTVFSDMFILQTNRLQLNGNGQFNLNDYAVQSQIQAKVSFNNDKADKIQDMMGGSFPILIKGTLNQLMVIPNLKKMTPLLTRMWLKETLAKPVKDIKQQLKTLFH
ncbi:AsmA family protein [Legionella spiritensis]|uniref:Putative asmA protein n=1 Tax=Legionella spiritensis TaxID=452 RepID=A0A0W0Z2L5_LEGSP|nr:AsmA family protein [Legionella spiritensis]KTD63356.1 putative asmA protein [Legionella spiritensis]SNV35389.1 putative asmA protein [Legionella spiritensis]VEG89749.1 putative asmA protein [Legionella spiritensis]